MSETGIENEYIPPVPPSRFIDGVFWGLAIVMMFDAAYIHFGAFTWLQK